MSAIPPFPRFEKPLGDDPVRSCTMPARSCDQGRLMVDPARPGTAEHGVHQFHRLLTQALDDRFDG